MRLREVASGELLEAGVRGGKADPAEDEQARGRGVRELGEHHDRAALDGAADEDLLLALEQLPELRHRGGDGRGRGPVEDEAERAVLAVQPDQHDGAREVRVLERRRSNQQTSCERFGRHLHRLPPASASTAG